MVTKLLYFACSGDDKKNHCLHFFHCKLVLCFKNYDTVWNKHHSYTTLSKSKWRKPSTIHVFLSLIHTRSVDMSIYPARHKYAFSRQHIPALVLFLRLWLRHQLIRMFSMGNSAQRDFWKHSGFQFENIPRGSFFIFRRGHRIAFVPSRPARLLSSCLKNLLSSITVVRFICSFLILVAFVVNLFIFVLAVLDVGVIVVESERYSVVVQDSVLGG